YNMIKNVLCQEVDYIWHKETAVTGYDALILPGGFSYGDYLRTGAIARFSPIMPAVIDFAHQGGLLLGICNGFQILLEAGLLPGVMLRNRSLKFICDKVYLKVKRNDTPFSNKLQPNEVINVPIAHGEGNYFCDAETLAELQGENRILFTYCNSNGQEENAFNPNGSVANIAGIINKQGNVLGMMPHPERCSEQILGGTDGYNIFASMLQSFQEVGC
ncbi:MAG: phosphoribosylformylglycinamidine synthase subunit PurQ, partial [Syntrophomonas sp.]